MAPKSDHFELDDQPAMMTPKVVADVCNAPVVMLKQEEGAAFGAALQALAMLEGAADELPALVLDHLERDPDRSVEPRSSAVSFYQDTYSRYQQAVDKVAELYGQREC